MISSAIPAEPLRAGRNWFRASASEPAAGGFREHLDGALGESRAEAWAAANAESGDTAARPSPRREPEAEASRAGERPGSTGRERWRTEGQAETPVRSMNRNARPSGAAKAKPRKQDLESEPAQGAAPAAASAQAAAPERKPKWTGLGLPGESLPDADSDGQVEAGTAGATGDPASVPAPAAAPATVVSAAAGTDLQNVTLEASAGAGSLSAAETASAPRLEASPASDAASTLAFALRLEDRGQTEAGGKAPSATLTAGEAGQDGSGRAKSGAAPLPPAAAASLEPVMSGAGAVPASGPDAGPPGAARTETGAALAPQAGSGTADSPRAGSAPSGESRETNASPVAAGATNTMPAADRNSSAPPDAARAANAPLAAAAADPASSGAPGGNASDSDSQRGDDSPPPAREIAPLAVNPHAPQAAAQAAPAPAPPAAGSAPSAADHARQAAAAPAQNIGSATLPSDPAPASAAPVRDLTLSVPSAPGSALQGDIALRVVERSGQVHVSVRTSEPATADALRDHLNRLVEGLEGRGFRTESWQPGSNPVPANASTHEGRNGAGAQEDGAPGGRQSGQGQSGERRESGSREQSGERPRWVEELEQQLR